MYYQKHTRNLITCVGRTLSTKSMPSGAEEEKVTGEPAKDFLLSTAKRSLDEAFGISVSGRF